jgi:hypothetical protein
VSAGRAFLVELKLCKLGAALIAIGAALALFVVFATVPVLVR